MKEAAGGGQGLGAWVGAWMAAHEPAAAVLGYIWSPGCNVGSRAVGTRDELSLQGAGMKTLQQSMG